MPITAISITATEPFADGQAFGEAGPYVRIRGVARGALDPQAPENAVIADLDKAPRNAAGLVEYATDFDMLRPTEPRRGSGILVYDVPNRGSKRIFNLLDDVPASDPARTNDPRTAADAGLGFCLGRGYSLVWSGWDPGAPRSTTASRSPAASATSSCSAPARRATAASAGCRTPPPRSTNRPRASRCA